MARPRATSSAASRAVATARSSSSAGSACRAEEGFTEAILPQAVRRGPPAHYPVGVQGFGVDIGGSGIKGCLVDLETGQLDRRAGADRDPAAVAARPRLRRGRARSWASFGWTGRIGVTFPGVMKHGVAHTAANVDKSWIGTDVDAGLDAS